MTAMTLEYARPSRMAAVDLMQRPVALLNLWYQRARQRRQLAGLDDRQLRDIGLSSDAAWHEADKPFWQA